MGPNESAPTSAGVAPNTKVLVDPHALPVLQHQTVKTSALRSSLGMEWVASESSLADPRSLRESSQQLTELDDVIEI